MKFKKNTYLSYLIETREKIISEENLINHHLYLKKIKTIISDLMDINNIKKTKYIENTFDFGSYKKLTTNLNIMEWLLIWILYFDYSYFYFSDLIN